MNVFYINCFADPWIQVAKELQSRYDFNPVYWNGYAFEDHSDILVPEAFPGILYSEDVQFWKGIFPKEIAERAQTMPIDIDFIKQYGEYELQAMTMMNRLDPDQRSFNFMERQRHYRNIVRSWLAAFDMLHPELVISPVIPHHVSDYILYWLCQYKKIPYIFCNHMNFDSARFFLCDNILSINDSFIRTYQLECQKSIQELESSIAPDIYSKYVNLEQSYEKGSPCYMSQNNILDKKSSNIFSLFVRFLQYLKQDNAHQTLFGSKGMLRYGVNVYFKERNKRIEGTYMSIWSYTKMRLRSISFKKHMIKYYSSIASVPDLQLPYVFFGMHYQPEATTSPSGDIFVDQRLCIDTLLKHTPKEYMIYVKEHPHQYFSFLDGHTSRMKDFYDDLAKNPRIKLVSQKVSTYSLVKNSKAVATIVGTLGLEAIVYQKPVICFGLCWYENYPGVLKIDGEKTALRISQHIETYHYDRHELLAYLSAASKDSTRAYYFKAEGKAESKLSEEECVNTMSAILYNKWTSIHER